MCSMGWWTRQDGALTQESARPTGPGDSNHAPLPRLCLCRLLIMTSNHPEKLDPALIRPGRIDKIIYLGSEPRSGLRDRLRHAR